jgi:hypothetical protein
VISIGTNSLALPRANAEATQSDVRGGNPRRAFGVCAQVGWYSVLGILTLVGRMVPCLHRGFELLKVTALPNLRQRIAG